MGNGGCMRNGGYSAQVIDMRYDQIENMND